MNTSLMRRCIELADNAAKNGNHPFGALLANKKGEILLEAENTVLTEDITCHAELNLIRKAKDIDDCILYTSTEPCCMCIGAIIYSNIRKVVFGTSVWSLNKLIRGDDADDSRVLPCREIASRKCPELTIYGPFLEDEANEVHKKYWSSSH